MSRHQIFALSAETPTQLASKLQVWLAGENLLQESGAACRLAICAQDSEELEVLIRQAQTALERGGQIDSPQIFLNTKPVGKIAWLFPGQGSQALGMLMSLRAVWPAFARELEALDRRCIEKFGHSVLDWITAEDNPANAAYLQDTRQAQPALGLVETALAKVWKASGLHADFYAGHSYGEIPALAAAGAFDDDTLLQLSHLRGQLLGEAGDLTPGGMLAARSDVKTLTPLLAALTHQIYVANDNAPKQVILAGSHEALGEAATLLQSAGISTVPLKTACAFHSPLMAPVVSRWQEVLTSIKPAPFTPGQVYANATAYSYSGLPEETRELLTRQITAPVQWRAEIEALHAAGCRVFIEIGSGRVLTDLVGKILGKRPHVRLASDPGKQPAEMALASLFAQLYSLGCNLDLGAFQPVAITKIHAIMTSAPTQPTAPETGFFEANQQAVCAFFQQQQHIVQALEGQNDSALFGELVRANQVIMQDFLATQQAALQLPGGVQIPASARATPFAPAANSTRASAEGWIISQLAEMTGLPAARIGRRTQFESELGIDSITLVELWVQLVERYPGLQSSSDQVSSITCIDDILARIDQATAAPATKPGAPAQGSIEHWLLNEISMLTGLPVDRLNRDTLFEADLGIDSITMVELWIKLVEEFPQFGEHTDGASKVKNVADVLKLVGADTPPQAAMSASKLNEHPASDWLARIRADLVTRIAQETGVDPAKITGQSHFTNDLGLDVFTRERIFEEEIGRNPKLAFAGRELLNVSNLDELSKL
ncbi:MAG: erythronolide synthase, partial [Proteobacteria bacterium]|nr:erythronolide synthase [Pseudomonadota bacterium]